MATIPLPKPINFSPLILFGNIILQPNVYNTIYVQAPGTATITLPDLSGPILDGFPFLIKSYNAFTTTINDASGHLVVSLIAGSSVILIADKEGDEWRAFIGPTGGSAGSAVSGPGSSTNNGLATWNGTSGTLLQSSSPVLADASGNLSSVNTLSAANGNFTTQLITPAAILFQTGAGQLELAATPIASGTTILTLPGVADTLVARNTTDTLTNKTITAATDIVAAQYLWNSSAAIIQINTTTPSSGQVLTATNSTAATWQNLPAIITGPGSTTTNAITRWANALGTALENSVVVVDNSGNFSGVNNIVASGNINAVNLQLTGNIVFAAGAATTTITTTPSGTHSITIPTPSVAGDSFVLATTASTMLNKTITDSSNVVYAAGLITTGSPVVVSAAAPPSLGQVLVATSATAANWQTITAVSGPGASTSNAIAVWNGTSGNSLLNTVVTLNPATGAFVGIGSLTYGSGVNATTFSNTPSGVNTMVLPTVSGGDTLVARTSTDTLTNKTYVYTVDPNVTAAGSTQGTAYSITKSFTFVTTSSAGNNGVVLPASVEGNQFIIVAGGGVSASVSVYPQSGAGINSLGANNPYTLTAGSTVKLMALSTTAWLTFV